AAEIYSTRDSHSPTLTSLEESDLIWEEFEAYLASDSFPPESDDTDFDQEGDLCLIEELLNNDPSFPLSLSHNPLSGIREMDSILEDSVDEGNLADPNNDLDDVNDDLVELESDNDDVYDDPFESKEDKIKESKLLIDELDPSRSSDFLPSPKCDSVLYEDFSEVYALPSTNNEDKVFNPGILIHENHFEVTNCAKNVKKLSLSNSSLILEDFNPPLYELPFHKEVPRSSYFSSPGIILSGP
ncbi:hypothetical protein Tco_1558467, partial [Tanacetum coccineum]